MESRILKFVALFSLGGQLIGCAPSETARPPLTAGLYDSPPTHAAALAQAEASVCEGIPLADRDAGPFGPSAQIVGVEPLVEPLAIGKQTYSRVTGAKVTVVGGPLLTRQWIARLAECHAARHAREGIAVDHGKSCPFADGPVAWSVMEAPMSFVVSLRATERPPAAGQLLSISERLRVTTHAVAQNQ